MKDKKGLLIMLRDFGIFFAVCIGLLILFAKFGDTSRLDADYSEQAIIYEAE